MLRSSKEPTVPGKNSVGLGVGAFILNEDNELLLMYRPKTIKSYRTTVNMWSVPGGAVDFGETTEEAVKRETYEELGVEIKIEKFIGFSDQILSNAHWVSFHYLCKIIKGKPFIKEPEKCSKINWFDPKNPPKQSGITHVLRPAYLLGYLSESEFKKRKKVTQES